MIYLILVIHVYASDTSPSRRTCDDLTTVRAHNASFHNSPREHDGGQVVTRDDGITSTADASIASAYPNNSTGSGQFRDDVAELAQKFDEDNVPEDGRYLFVSPYIRTILRHEGSSWGSTIGG